MITPESFDDVYPAAMLANRPLHRLGEDNSKKLVERMYNAMLDAIAGGGYRHEVIRDAKQAARGNKRYAIAIEVYGEVQFSDLALWMYERLHGQREAVS